MAVLSGALVLASVIGACAAFWWVLTALGVVSESPFQDDDLAELTSFSIEAPVRGGIAEGAVIVISKGRAGLTSAYGEDSDELSVDDLDGELPENEQAKNPAEVDVVVLVDWDYVELASYSPGGAAYEAVCEVSIWTRSAGEVDWSEAVCVCRRQIDEDVGEPPTFKSGTNDLLIGGHPDESVAAYVTGALGIEHAVSGDQAQDFPQEDAEDLPEGTVRTPGGELEYTHTMGEEFVITQTSWDSVSEKYSVVVMAFAPWTVPATTPFPEEFQADAGSILYCATLSVTNLSTQLPVDWPVMGQDLQLRDAAGRTYQDVIGLLSAGIENAMTAVYPIPPGVTAELIVVFEVPEDAAGYEIIHELDYNSDGEWERAVVPVSP
jgi:hypothetical protein